MNGIDFGPGSPGCIDCIDGHCTMNCSPRGRADLPTRRKQWDGRSSTLENEQALGVAEFARRQTERAPPDETMSAIAAVLSSGLSGIPLQFYNPPATDQGEHPLYEILGKRPSLALVDDIEWWPDTWRHIPVGNLYQPGGALNTSEDRPQYRFMDEGKLIEREQVADLMGLRIFADPRVPRREIWMGIDLSNKPDVTAYMDEDGNLHIITPGESL